MIKNMENLRDEILRLNLKSIIQTKEKLKDHIIETPTIKFNSSFLKKINPNTEIFMKLELFQHTGTFKARGALSAASQINKNKRKFGITAASAGNHAIAASYAANKFNIKSKIFMYKSANKFRIKTVKSFTSNIIFSEPNEVFKKMNYCSINEGYKIIQPFDGIYTIQGTATLGYEICNQVDNLDNIIISVGGGGLISGIGSIVKQRFPKCKIIGVEPKGASGLTKSLKAKKPLKNIKVNTIADSLGAPLHMPYSFSVCEKVIDQMILVSDYEMKKSMRFMFDNFRLILEPACVAGIAALNGKLKNKLKNQKTLVVLCGTNIDLKSWINILN